METQGFGRDDPALEETQECVRCQTEKPLSEFAFMLYPETERMAICKACVIRQEGDRRRATIKDAAGILVVSLGAALAYWGTVDIATRVSSNSGPAFLQEAAPPGGLVLGIGVYFVVFWVMGRGVDAFLGRKAFDDGIGFEWVFMAFICGMASFILLTIASAVLRQQ